MEQTQKKKTSKPFSPEFRERAVRLAMEHRGECQSEAAALTAIAGKLDCSPDTVTSAFDQLRPQTFDGSGASLIRDFRSPPERLSEIRRYIFGGFTKGCYQLTKVDSDTERKLSVILEQDTSVKLWMKPGPNQFKVYDTDGLPYQPDFVVETETAKLIIETKANNQMFDTTVLRKAEAAGLWCHIATEVHGKQTGDKPWSYLLVPELAVQPNTSVNGLAATYLRLPDAEMLSRFDLEKG